MTGCDEEAMRLFPELASLITMREAGWRFRPQLDDAGDVVLLDGLKTYADFTDAVRIRDREDVLGMRCAANGRVVWERHGSLPEIVEELNGGLR